MIGPLRHDHLVCPFFIREFIRVYMEHGPDQGIGPEQPTVSLLE